MKFFALLFALFISAVLFGQNYKLVPDTCTLCIYFWGQSGGTLWEDSYRIDPVYNTTIDSNNYVKILGTVRPEQPSYIRQEGNILYGRHSDSLVDVKLMDFDALVGDTISDLYSEGFLYRAVVEEKDSFILNDGTYNTFMNLSVAEVFYNGGWQSDSWGISWSEGGICNVHNYPSNYGLGGVLYNMQESYYQGLEVAYYAPNYCTLDSNYTMTNGSTCQYCVGQSGNSSLIEQYMFNFEIYPNPAKSEINLEFSTIEKRTVSINNLLGETVFTLETVNQQIPVDISDLDRGCYIINVQKSNTNIRRSKRLVLQ